MTSEPAAEPYPEPEPIRPEPEPEPEFEIINNNSSINSTLNSSFLYSEGTFFRNGTPEPEPTTEPEPYVEPEPPAMSQHFMPVIAVLAAVIGLLIILENLMVLVTLYKGKPKQPLSVTFFIGNLAVADFVAGIHLIWFVCFDYFLFKRRPAMYIIVMCGLWLVSVAVSIISLFNFGIYRLKIARSKEIIQQNGKGSIAMVIASWILPIAFLIVPPLAGWNCDTCVGKDYCEKKCSMILFPFTKLYTFILAVFLLAAIVGLFGIYLWMLYSVHHKVMTMKKKDKVRKKEIKLIKTVAFLLCLFSFCTVPVGVLLVIDYLTIDYNQDLIVSFQVLSVISFINSIFNPFVYIWRLPAMKVALRKTLGIHNMEAESNSKILSVISRLTNKQKNTSTIQKKSSLSVVTSKTCMDQKGTDQM